MKRRTPAPAAAPIPINWPRANPADLVGFDPASKVCTMNCGQCIGDPRSQAELKFLCDDCVPAPPPPPAPCAHRIADIRNPVVKSGYMCVDCGALFAAADHEVAPATTNQGPPV